MNGQFAISVIVVWFVVGSATALAGEAGEHERNSEAPSGETYEHVIQGKGHDETSGRDSRTEAHAETPPDKETYRHVIEGEGHNGIPEKRLDEPHQDTAPGKETYKETIQGDSDEDGPDE